ncbi:TRAP transporter small permease [Arhodomonas sp. AD133]|uniref:TRAP transporter small permease n=1 Tax=Arhodomonas sp. AD133 TaxID=3415009 RepID=UPI003EBDF685
MPENKSKGGLGKVFHWIDRGTEMVESFILATGVLAMAVLSITNVIARNVFNNSLAFTEESNQLLLVMVTFMGIGYGVRHGRHIRMSAFHDMFGPTGRKVLMIITSLCTGALMFYLAWHAFDYAYSVMQRGRVTPAMRMPLWLVYMWVPLGLFIGGVQYALACLRNLISAGPWLAYNKRDEMEEAPGVDNVSL